MHIEEQTSTPHLGSFTPRYKICNNANESNLHSYHSELDYAAVHARSPARWWRVFWDKSD